MGGRVACEGARYPKRGVAGKVEATVSGAKAGTAGKGAAASRAAGGPQTATAKPKLAAAGKAKGGKKVVLSEVLPWF